MNTETPPRVVCPDSAPDAARDCWTRPAPPDDLDGVSVSTVLALHDGRLIAQLSIVRLLRWLADPTREDS